MTLAIGTVTGRLATAAVTKSERAWKGIGRKFETGDKLTFVFPKTAGSRKGG
jgi:hypothetical protein